MKTRPWPILLLVSAACSRGDGGSFGLAQRVPVSGLTFPTGLPQPGSMQAEVAFPNLLLQNPLFLTAPADGTDRIFVVEQGGRIHVFPNDPQVAATTVFLDMSSLVNAGGEEGLLGLAFHPGYAANGTFYTYHSTLGPRRTVVSRWQVSSTDPDVADAASQQVLLEIDQPFGNHKGGALAFGPDGMLYVAVGDGGSGNDPMNNAQSLTTLLGKVLRLAPDGSIPADNPFAGGAAGERGEIWAYGLRNPWRMSFDRATGTLWLGDVGQNAVEEIDVILRGRNYGWRVYEGHRSNVNPSSLPASAFEPPVHTYDQPRGFSVTGGYVYRGSALPSLVGAYVYGDYSAGRVWALAWDGSQVVAETEIARVSVLASFGEDEAGELYLCSFDGRIYRLEESAGGGTPAPFPATLSATGLFADVVALRPSPGVIEYDVNAPLWSDGARKRRWIALPGTSRIGFDPTEAWTFPIGTVLVKHFEIDVAPGQTKRLETRVLLRHSSGWQGYTYRWNVAGTDADLLSTGASETFTVREPGGAQRLQTWSYPSRSDCLTCHTTAAGVVLGVGTRQLNRDFAYPIRVDNQLRSWNHIGLFAQSIGDHGQYEAMPDPADESLPVADRARSYLMANCAMCHRPQGPTPVDLDLRYGIPAAQTNAIGVAAQNPVGGVPGALRISAGVKEQSDLWERMRRRDPFGMPPLASHEIDRAAVDLIGRWIDGGAQ